MVILLFAVFFILLFAGIPIAYSLGISSLVYIITNNIPLAVIAQKAFYGMDSFTLLCIPGFVLAGNLMNSGGITDRIVDLSNKLIGHIRGGLSLGNIISSMIFAGISGTALADTASIGGVMIPAMKKQGYSSEFSAAVTSASSTIGPIIPPSLPMIIVGSLTGVSVGKMFIAGAVPGIMLGVGMLIVSFYISKKKQHPMGRRTTIKEKLVSLKDAFWAIMLTVFILYGILGGLFTPTEASIGAVVYAVIIGTFVYKKLTFRKIPGIILASIIMTASIMLLIGFANLFAWILTYEQIPQLLADSISQISQNKIIILLIINLILLFIGTFMETIAALVIMFPVLLKVVEPYGIDPIQFGVIVVLNLIIGLSTPPVGVCLFTASSIGETSMTKTVKEILPFLAIAIFVLLLVTYIPAITLYLPALVKG